MRFNRNALAFWLGRRRHRFPVRAVVRAGRVGVVDGVAARLHRQGQCAGADAGMAARSNLAAAQRRVAARRRLAAVAPARPRRARACAAAPRRDRASCIRSARASPSARRAGPSTRWPAPGGRLTGNQLGMGLGRGADALRIRDAVCARSRRARLFQRRCVHCRLHRGDPRVDRDLHLLSGPQHSRQRVPGRWRSVLAEPRSSAARRSRRSGALAA